MIIPESDAVLTARLLTVKFDALSSFGVGLLHCCISSTRFNYNCNNNCNFTTRCTIHVSLCARAYMGFFYLATALHDIAYPHFHGAPEYESKVEDVFLAALRGS